MKQFITKPIAILFISILLVMSACQKQIDVVYDDIANLQNFKTEAKAWFTNGVVLQEKKLLDLPHNILPENAPERLFARMGKIEKKLEWENAELYNRDDVQYLVVPITTNLKKYSNDYEIAKSIVFYKLNGGEMNMTVIELLSKKGTSFDGKANEILAAAFINKVKDKKEAVPVINASLFFYDKHYKNIGSYEFNNGAFTPSRKKLIIKNQSGIGVNDSQINPGLSTPNSSCETWYVVYDWRDENGNLISWEILYSYFVGDCTAGNEDPEEEMPEGVGAGGWNGIFLEDWVLNLVNDTCQNAALTAISGVGINNTISQYYNGFSTPNSPINLTFVPGSVSGGGPAVTTPTGNHHYTTTLSNDQLAYGSFLMSQEAWGAIIAHEILHIYISEGNISNIQPNTLAHHQAIFVNLITTTRDLLHNAFGLDNTVATKLALNGMADLWQNMPYTFDNLCMTLYGYTQAQINATFAQYTTGLLGTRCN
ncbi:hypothetical protein [Ferruginibacter sp.]|nr:hypothetical protein [Ferruginibacter sp.]